MAVCRFFGDLCPRRRLPGTSHQPRYGLREFRWNPEHEESVDERSVSAGVGFVIRPRRLWMRAGQFGGILRTIAYLGSPACSGLMAYHTYSTMQDRAVMRESVDQLTEMRRTDPADPKTPGTRILRQRWQAAGRPAQRSDRSARSRLRWSWPTTSMPTPSGNWSTGMPCKPRWPKRRARSLLQEYQKRADDVAAIKAGTIQIVAMHARRRAVRREQRRLHSGRRARNRGGAHMATAWTSPSPPTARSKRSPTFVGIS